MLEKVVGRLYGSRNVAAVESDGCAAELVVEDKILAVRRLAEPLAIIEDHAWFGKKSLIASNCVSQ